MIPAIEISVEAGNWPSHDELGALVAKAVRAAIDTARLKMPADAELSLLFTADAQMQAINRRWRSADKTTNVLSFPGSDMQPGQPASHVLGDIILAQETIAREAALDGKAFEHHLTHLVVHGLLHLFGYDHMNDDEAEAMETLERAALASLGIKDPYLER